MGFLWFKSKQEKELERRMAVHHTLNELDKCSKSMNKKKDEMIKIAKQAKQAGLQREYATARNGLISMMKYSQTLEAIRLRVKIAESMRDMSSASMKAVNSMGALGKELSGIIGHMDLARNQATFEMGSMRMEEMMTQMEDMLESTTDLSGAMDNAADTDFASEADKLIESVMVSQPSKEDQEIDSLLAGLEKKRTGI